MAIGSMHAFEQLHARWHAGCAGRQRPCGAALSFTVMLQVAVNWIHLCYNLRTATCAFFRISRDGKFLMSSKNLTRIIRYSRIQAMPYTHRANSA